MSSENLQESKEKLPDLELAQMKHILSLPEYKNDEELKNRLLQGIKKNLMGSWYKELCTDLQWNVDVSFMSAMQAQNLEDLAKLEDNIARGLSSMNELEIREDYMRKAEYLTQICDEDAIQALELVYVASDSVTQRVDILFHCVRIGLFFMDHKVFTYKYYCA